MGGGLIHNCMCSPCVLGVEVFGGEDGGWGMVVGGGSGVGVFFVGEQRCG